MSENREKSELAMKKERALMMMDVCLGLALLSLLVMPTFAGTWYSESEYAYFLGDIVSWDRDPSFHPSHGHDNTILAYPNNFTWGDDPTFEVFLFNHTDIVYQSGSTQCFLESFDVRCYLGSLFFGGNISTVQLNHDGKDLYASGTWKIDGTMWLLNANVADIKYYSNGSSMPTIVVVMTSTNGAEDFIKKVTAFADEMSITDVRVYTEANVTDGVPMPDPGITIDYAGDIDINGEPRCSFVQIAQKAYDSSGEIYVTGNWTDITINIQGLGTLSGKVYELHKFGTSTDPTDPTDPADPPDVKADARADLDGDHRITILDIAAGAFRFGATKDTELYDPRVDINSDDVINILDIAIIAKNFGLTY